MYDENVSKLSDSETYKAMCLIYKYFCSVDKDIAKGIKEKMLDEMKINGVASARMGAAIGREYYKYLDSKIFGIGSNDFFTVGHTLTTNEKKEFPVLRPYSYMFNKQIGGPSPRPEVGPTFLFKNGTSGKVIVDVKMYRQGYVSQNTCSTVAYIKNLGTFELDTRKSDTENAKIVAQYCNKLGTEIRKFAQKNQTLLQMLPLGAKPEYF
jgi:hypothetical protein